jgi:hypothetical protein
MDTQKTISQSVKSESLNTTKGHIRSAVSSEGKSQEKQKAKRPNYMLRLL